MKIERGNERKREKGKERKGRRERRKGEEKKKKRKRKEKGELRMRSSTQILRTHLPHKRLVI